MRGTKTKLLFLCAALSALVAPVAFVAFVAVMATRILARRDPAQQVALRAGALESERVAEPSSAEGTAEPAETTESASRALSFLVHDPASRPLEGASVLASVRGREERLGATDVEGRLRSALPAGAGARLRVELAGFRPDVLLVPEEPVDPLVVVLHPLRRIEGRVRRSNGDPAGADLLVMAWPRSAPPPVPAQVVFAMSRAESELDGLRTTRTRADGSFVFEAVPWSGIVTLDAGGSGLVTAAMQASGGRSHETSAEGDAEVELRVRRGYGAVIELVDASGAPLARAGGAPWPAVIGTREPGASAIPALTASAVAAGFDPSLVEERIDRLPVVVSNDQREDVIEGVSFAMDAAGYAPAHASFDVHALERVTPIVRIALTRTASGFGALDLRFVNAPAALASMPRERYATGRLELTNLDGSSTRIYAVTPDATWRARLADLPHGNHTLRFRLAGFLDPALARMMPEDAARGFSDPPEESSGALVTIGSEPARHTIDLAALNWIVIELEDAQGAAWCGTLQAMLVAGEMDDGSGGIRISGGMRMLSFAAPPYVFAGLRPELSHALRLSSPRARSLASGNATERFSVPAGGTQLLRFRVAD